MRNVLKNGRTVFTWRIGNIRQAGNGRYRSMKKRLGGNSVRQRPGSIVGDVICLNP